MPKHQFADVDYSRFRGAPMGRSSYGSPDDCPPRSVRLFRVRFIGGDYDDGGAYWGGGPDTLPLYCATGPGYCDFARSRSRALAHLALNIPQGKLAWPIGAERKVL